MDTGGLAQMTCNNFQPGASFGAPGSGFASRGKGANLKRLSVALPPKVGSISEHQSDIPTPRTSRSHLLAGLRTAPKAGNGPASAPFSQSHNQYGMQQGSQWADAGYNIYEQSVPHSAMGSGFGNNQYVMNAGQQAYALPEQVLAPPSFYAQDDEMDPNVLEQLQMTGLFLAQRQQQLQQQLASITAAANQFQGQYGNAGMPRSQSLSSFAQQGNMYAHQQQVQAPIEVPGQPGLYLVFNPATGQYQYVSDNAEQQGRRSTSPQNNDYVPMTDSPMGYKSHTPTFRAEISPPPQEKPLSASTRSITPPKISSSPQTSLEHVQPLPPPSATAFRRGHKKASSLALSLSGTAPDGPKTASTATFGSARSVFPNPPMTGTFGPGAARAGEHPVRQPRGPPSLEELVALPTAKHEGSKNFATRQRRRALNNLMRAGSVRRASGYSSGNGTPTSERELCLQLSEEDEMGFVRKQSPIGSERSLKRGSPNSAEGFGTGSAVNTPASEEGNAFDMGSFVKQLPAHIQQAQPRRKAMLGGVLNAAEKRRSMY